MIPLRNALSKHRNGTYVTNIALWDSVILDQMSEFFLPMNDEVAAFAQKVQSDPKLAQGFDAIGISQGSLIIRGYVQRYNSPPVVNFLSIHGPMAGVAGFPHCPYKELVCQLFDRFLGELAYTGLAQRSLAQANYLRDPLRIPEYLQANPFLPDLNNELPVKNMVYRENFIKLRKLVLVKALKDTMVLPKDSAWFGFYADGSTTQVLPMIFTSWFREDSFGLRTLDNNGRIFFESTPDDHTQFSTEQVLRFVDLYFN
eukprot:GGOE01000326.1.p1 GENE.GGOE01000326.1~~GGOE01000326.1.p1  ORF type:complete len:302 (+),score=92.45 GGOE01000326.1:136-906(+)